MARYRATIEYDGTAYQGFQRQRQPATIQETLERAIAAVSQQGATVTGAGRTDSGVHAAGQVVSFAIEWRHGEASLQRALNANLPADIQFLTLTETEDPSWHPRYSARRRAYRYTIYHGLVGSPLQRRTSWYVSRPLAVARMNEAADYLVGTQDFATFGKPPKGENTVRQVFRAQWQQRGTLITFDIDANAFLYRMVRAIVGSLKLVGDGSWTVDDFVAALQACDRSRAGALAPPQGLVLMSVTYD